MGRRETMWREGLTILLIQPWTRIVRSLTPDMDGTVGNYVDGIVAKDARVHPRLT